MPHKFNAPRRHKFAKKRYRVTNWSSYNECLRQRGDVTVWLSPEVEDGWRAERRKTRGGQLVYSDLAITACLTLRMVYKQPLRQTEGLVRGLVRLMGLDLSVPGFSTLSRRGAGLNLSKESKVQRDEPLHLVVDSTGLKIFGEDKWLQNKHRTKAKRKSWRKLHLGLDLVSGDIVCSDLTNDDVGDTTALPDLLEQIDADVAQFITDGAYDGDPTSNLFVERFSVGVEIIIPPPKNAVLGPTAAHDPSLRDQRIAAIRTVGRMAWQVSSGYNQRSRGETQMGRWKTVIGPKLKARSFPNQKTEAKIGAHVLNSMTELGRPMFEPVA
ncbi:IS5 family transposase [Sedimentitalea sp.]|uniref:IS5 family transposase n=1 Tax=Sedimentitalea sp. TaxID=2048915 RepID=UPI00329A15A3